MFTRPAVAIILAGITVISAVPMVPATATECAVPGCRTIALYARPGTLFHDLSSLAGHSAVDDPATWSHTYAFGARTQVLEFGLTIEKHQAFRSVFVNGFAAPDFTGDIVISAVDAHGRKFTLATAAVGSPTDPIGASQRSAAAMWSTLVATGENATATGGYGMVDEHLCPSTPDADPLCGVAAGQPGFGSFRPCAASPPPNNAIVNAFWTAAQAADSAVRVVSGEGICGRDARPIAEQFATSLDNTIGANGTQLPPYPATAPPLRLDWRDVTLDATPPAFFAQDNTKFTIPTGMLLEWTLTTRPHTGATPPVFPLGRADALTRLEITTTTPRAFSRLAFGAEPTAPGEHSVVFAHDTDAHDYSFEVPVGWRVEAVTSSASALSFTLWTPDGDITHAIGQIGADGVIGKWILRAEQGPASNSPSGTLLLRIFVPPSIAPPELLEGTTTDSLGPDDSSDSFSFFAWKGQHFTLTLEHPTYASYSLEVDGSYDQASDNTSGVTRTFSGRALTSGSIMVEVERDFGEGSYTLTLERNDAEDLSAMPALSPMATFAGAFAFGSISGYDDGVDLGLGIRGPNWTDTVQTFRVDDQGVGLLTDDPSIFTARSASGALVHGSSWGRVVMDGPNGTIPLIPGGGPMAFGPDGSLYANYFQILRFHEDRTIDSLVTRTYSKLVFAPNGSMHALSVNSGEPIGIDPATGDSWPETGSGRALAFDAAGARYHVALGSLVERVDPITNARTTVAYTPSAIADLAISGSRLFMLTYDDAIAEVVSVPLDAVGFDGFHPDFDPLPAPDLLMSNFSDEVIGISVDANGRLGEDHILHVTVANGGHGPAYNIGVATVLVCPLCTSSFNNNSAIDFLARDGQVTLDLSWHAAGQVGDHEFRIYVDQNDANAETNETNNAGAGYAHVLVSGNQALCQQALGRDHLACELTR